jgi:hypothetical protein
VSELSKDSRNAGLARSPDSRLGLASVTPATRGRRVDALEFFRCLGCGEVIGVYEPIVAEDGGGARTTSRAAEPDLRANAATYYHRECYATAELPEPRTASG